MDITKDEQKNEDVDLKKRTRILLLNKVNEAIYQLFPQGSDDEREKKFYKSVMSEFIIKNNEVEQNPQLDNYHAKKSIKETFLKGNSNDVLVLIKILLDCLDVELKAKDNNCDIYEEFNKYFQKEKINCSFKNQIFLIEDKSNENKDGQSSNTVKKFFNEWGTVSAIVVVFLTILSGMNKLTIMGHFNISYKFLAFNFTELFTLLIMLSIIIILIIITPFFCFKYEKKNYKKGLAKDYVIIKVILYVISCYFINIYFINTVLKSLKFGLGFDVNYIFSFIIVCFGLWPIYFEQNKIYDNKKFQKSKFFVIKLILTSLKLFVTIFLYLMLIQMFLDQILGNDIRYKTHYEQIMYNEEPYIILTLMDGKAIIAKFDDCNIYTDSYLIIDITDKVITSKVFEKPPKILPE